MQTKSTYRQLAETGLLMLLGFSTAASAREIYVSPTGTGTGTVAAPFGSIQSAVDAAAAGDVIYLRAGTYKPSANIQIGKSGTRTQPITFRAFGAEKVILDGENMPGTPYAVGQALPNKERGILHIQNANYWLFSRLELINGPYGVYARDASHNYYEHISTHDNYETGFQLEGASANNTVIYLDSYRNRDPRKNGESADGFACKSGSGEGNVLRNARLWDNVDDGLDLFEFTSGVLIEEVYVWANGFNRWNFSPFEGDGNAMKLGIKGQAAARHVVRNSMAWGNFKKGFIDNGNPGTLTLERNTAWNNGDVGFDLRSGSKSVVKSNVAVANIGSAQVSLISGTVASGNSWQSGSWSAASFKSTDPKTLMGARGADGRVAASDFLLPKSGEAIGATTRERI
ncbi:pectate disaccharide-lyase [Microdochium nivale]|nr:pectate disaccharide-lyase [Microdochium nivale]